MCLCYGKSQKRDQTKTKGLSLDSHTRTIFVSKQINKKPNSTSESHQLSMFTPWYIRNCTSVLGIYFIFYFLNYIVNDNPSLSSSWLAGAASLHQYVCFNDVSLWKHPNYIYIYPGLCVVLHRETQSNQSCLHKITKIHLHLVNIYILVRRFWFSPFNNEIIRFSMWKMKLQSFSIFTLNSIININF